MNTSLTHNEATYGGAVCVSGQQSDVLINNAPFRSNRATAHGPDVHTNGTIKRLKVRNPTWSMGHIGEEEYSHSWIGIMLFAVALISITVFLGFVLAQRYLIM